MGHLRKEKERLNPLTPFPWLSQAEKAIGKVEPEQHWKVRWQVAIRIFIRDYDSSFADFLAIGSLLLSKLKEWNIVHRKRKPFVILLKLYNSVPNNQKKVRKNR